MEFRSQTFSLKQVKNHKIMRHHNQNETGFDKFKCKEMCTFVSSPQQETNKDEFSPFKDNSE